MERSANRTAQFAAANRALARFAKRAIETLAASGDRCGNARIVERIAMDEIGRKLTNLDEDVRKPLFDLVDDLVEQLSHPLDARTFLRAAHMPGRPRRDSAKR